jgi:hypothetical protein
MIFTLVLVGVVGRLVNVFWSFPIKGSNVDFVLVLKFIGFFV